MIPFLSSCIRLTHTSSKPGNADGSYCKETTGRETALGPILKRSTHCHEYGDLLHSSFSGVRDGSGSAHTDQARTCEGDGNAALLSAASAAQAWPATAEEADGWTCESFTIRMP